MPLNIQKALFKPFERGDTYRVNEGYGLGKSIVKAIVDPHLGEITFEAAEGEGETFIIDFPALNSSETAVHPKGLPE